MKISQHLTPINHSNGRNGHQPFGIVLHVSEGSLASMRNWFRDPAAKVSAHYGIGRDGSIEQYVSEDDAAWHCGLKIRPTAKIVLDNPTVNPNDITIGIEHEGFATQKPTEAQLRASADLCAEIADRRAISLDRDHVIGHREIRADKTCPGLIDPSAVLALIDQPQIGERRWSEFHKEYIFLVGYKNDRDWRFVKQSFLEKVGLYGSVSWSSMPKEPK